MLSYLQLIVQEQKSPRLRVFLLTTFAFAAIQTSQTTVHDDGGREKNGVGVSHHSTP